MKILLCAMSLLLASTLSLAGEIKCAVAVLHPLQESGVSGIVRFTVVEEGVRVEAEVHGLPPSRTLGFHIHEFGDCSAPDGSSAGGHYNPAGHPHGAPGRSTHAGDLGNLQSDAQGVGRYDKVLNHFSLDEQSPVIGRAVIVHEKADDLKSQPTGEAGGRIACGVIGIAK